MLVKCFGCLGEFEKTSEALPSHPYIGAIPECWKTFGEVLAREYQDPAYGTVHRITADTYAAQHIGDQSDRRARQSANLHLIGLYLTYDQNLSADQVVNFFKKATKTKRDWSPLLQIENPSWLTVQDIVKAKDPTSHAELVYQWGQSVWKSYTSSKDQRISFRFV